MCNLHTNFRVRKGASALKATDACSLLTSALPVVHQIMTAAQIEQLQLVLDAGGNAASKSVLVSKWHLSSTKLLATDALSPTTKNPDETAYLNEIRQTLLQKGVWLRIDERPLRLRLPPRLYLSLGPDGDEIPTKDGRLTRENLLANGSLGAGYESKVNQGPQQKAELEKAIKRLCKNIEAGELQCKLLAQQVLEEDPRITGAKNLLGGRGFSGFPFSTIWAEPRKLMEKAEKFHSGGEIRASGALFLKASILATKAAKKINAYIDDTSTGALRAVAVLEWVEIVGAWAGLFSGSGAGGGSKGGAAVKTGGQVRANSGAVYPGGATNYQGRAAFAKTVNQGGGTVNSTGAGSINRINRYDAATQTRLDGWWDTVAGELLKNPNGTLAEKLEILKRADAKWGNPMEFLH